MKVLPVIFCFCCRMELTGMDLYLTITGHQVQVLLVVVLILMYIIHIIDWPHQGILPTHNFRVTHMT